MIVVERRNADVRALNGIQYDPQQLVDDGRDWKGIHVRKPWGHEVEIYRNGALSFWRLIINPGAETSMHAHPGKRTVLMVEAGECVIETLTGSHELVAGDIAHIERGAFHRTLTKKGAILIEMETPANKRDLVRLEDRYGRQGMAYEAVG